MFGNNGQNLSSRDKANYLVREIGKRVHVPGAQLDSNEDRSFGDFGFSYDAQKGVLKGRVYITKADLDGGPKILEAIHRVNAALDDPSRGGLFEHAGGYFYLDEKKAKLFLVKDFPVDKTTPTQLWTQMEDLIDLGARWTMKWFGHVAGIAHGWEPPPSHPVTRQNGPLSAQLIATAKCP